MEIVGLCKSTVRWLAELCDKKKFSYAGVSKLQDGMFSLHYNLLSYKELPLNHWRHTNGKSAGL